MTPDGALARELADKLQHRVICVGQFNGIDIDPDGKMVTLAECDELVALLRKWPEPCKHSWKGDSMNPLVCVCCGHAASPQEER